MTCASWSDIWLNEGFATYSEALWEEAKAGPADGQAALSAAMAARRPVNAQGAVYIPDPSSVSRIFSHDLSYLKGGWVLHMLRGVLGDEDFFAMLAAYRQAYAFQAVSTEDLRAVAESVADTSLGWFFDQWVYGHGVPSYACGHQQLEVGGQRYVALSVDQDQGAGLPPFRMPLRFRLTGAGLNEAVTVWNWAFRQHYLIPISGPVDWVELDPDQWVLDAGRRTVPYVAGPPKILAVSPGPGEAAEMGQPVTISVSFYEPVSARASDFTVSGDRTGQVGFDYAYDQATNTARLTTTAPLARDRYTITVSDSIVGLSNGLHLDGETGAAGGASLPSGDGIPGGSAVLSFDSLPVPRRYSRAGS